jgi:thiamine biosynthesis protein ThiS
MPSPLSSSPIIVNGVARTVPGGWSVAMLLRDAGVRSERVAVEVNHEIVDRGDYDTRLLHPGDDVEIITFVGGGSC